MKLKYERIGSNYASSKEKGMFARIVNEDAGQAENWEIALVYYKPHHTQAEHLCKLFTAAPDLLEAAKLALIVFHYDSDMEEDFAPEIDALTKAITKATE